MQQLKRTIILDTNMILRYLLNDNEEMALAAERYILKENVYVTTEVISEAVYVLKGVYSLDRGLIAETINSFLELVQCRDREVIVFALDTFSKVNIDFVDCILFAYSKVKRYEVVTFDKKLLKLLKDKGGNE